MNLVPTVLWGFRADGIQFPPHLLQAANRTIFSFQNFIVLANTHLNFTVKYNRRNFLLPLIAGAFPVAGVTYAIIKDPNAGMIEFNKHPIGIGIILLFMLIVFGYFGYNFFFDTKTKLIINSEGIWTSKC